MNNLDPEVAENPDELVVYGGIGKAARDWESFEKIIETLKVLENDETMLVQSGKPVAVFKTHENAPRVLIANSNLVPGWANWDHFYELEERNLMMYGQMTAGSWILAFIPGIILFRMMLVKWNLDKMGRGVLLVTIIGMLLVFFLI